MRSLMCLAVVIGLMPAASCSPSGAGEAGGVDAAGSNHGGGGSGGSSQAAGGNTSTSGGGRPDGPVSGEIAGEGVTMVGGTVSQATDTWVVELHTEVVPCGGVAMPADGVATVVVNIPTATPIPGSYSIPGDGIGVGATVWVDDGTGLTQRSIVVGSGTLWIDTAATTIEGALMVDSSDVTLSGAFAAPICM